MNWMPLIYFVLFSVALSVGSYWLVAFLTKTINPK